jgi:ribosomal protein L37E
VVNSFVCRYGELYAAGVHNHEHVLACAPTLLMSRALLFKTVKEEDFMYCPQCGQQQASAEMRFCSRCGFPLARIAEVLAQGGVMATHDATIQRDKISPRQRGIRQGAMLMMSTMLVVPIIVFAILLLHVDKLIPLIPLSAVVCFVGGLLRIIYALLFEDVAPPSAQASVNTSASSAPSELNSPSHNAQALPPAPGRPAQDWRRRPETAEIIQPPSVTENTTRILKSKDEG